MLKSRAVARIFVTGSCQGVLRTLYFSRTVSCVYMRTWDSLHVSLYLKCLSLTFNILLESKINIYTYPRYEVYRGYIVFAFIVIMFVCLG